MPKVTNLDQRVELIAADVEDIKANGLGPEPIDAYTKTESDLKFQTIAGMSAYQTTAGMSSYLTTANAALIYQPIGSYLTATDIADMATQTWVGQQGFLTSSDVDEVPSVGSGDNGKVLTAVYNDGVASYSWQTPQVVSYTKAEADAKFQTISGMSSYLTSADAASTYQAKGSYATTTDIADMATQTWVGSQSYLTQSAASSTYLTQSDASSTYLPSATARQVPAPVAADDGKVLTAASNGTYSWETASSGGTSDYTDLTNKPSINNVTLSGNKSTSDLGIDEVPSITSSDGGKFLRANYYNATGTSDYSWETIPTPSVDEVPDVTSSDDGKVLTASYSGGQGSYAWATAASGGLSVETDGTNYWITVNGIRLYFGTTAPTGNIPANSYGFGW